MYNTFLMYVPCAISLRIEHFVLCCGTPKLDFATMPLGSAAFFVSVLCATNWLCEFLAWCTFSFRFVSFRFILFHFVATVSCHRLNLVKFFYVYPFSFSSLRLPHKQRVHANNVVVLVVSVVVSPIINRRAVSYVFTNGCCTFQYLYVWVCKAKQQ